MSKKKMKLLSHKQWRRREGLLFAPKHLPEIQRQKKSAAGQMDFLHDESAKRK